MQEGANNMGPGPLYNFGLPVLLACLLLACMMCTSSHGLYGPYFSIFMHEQHSWIWSTPCDAVTVLTCHLFDINDRNKVFDSIV